METLDRTPTFAITYKDDGNQDGICSQLLRIYGIYAISRFLKVPYVHSPVAHLGYHGLTALENNAPIPGLLDEVNRVFDIPSDIDLTNGDFAGRRVTVHDMVDADLKTLKDIKNTGSRDKGLDLVRILYPFPVTDPNPEIYRCLKRISPFPYRRSGVFRLAIHVRRGECLAVATDWMLPNSYYTSCALRFHGILRKLGIPCVCELYTEVPSKRFEVTPEHHGIYGRIAENVVFDPAMNQLDDFEAIPNLERFINLDPIESLRRMATADALIISHSSFSYFPAILNPDCIVVYHPYWRGSMKHWLISDDNGVFPERDLAELLQTWKQAAHVPPRNLDREIEKLLQPFRTQSAAIRSIVVVGQYRVPGIAEEIATLRFVVEEDRVRPAIQVEPLGRCVWTLNSLAEHAREMAGSSAGEDLLVASLDLLNEKMTQLSEEFSFRAVVALFPGASSGKVDQSDWRLRRSLFDRGLICIGSLDFAEAHALCFLASDAVRCFNRLDVACRGHIAMSSLLDGVGFANQLWRYACVKLYALRHGLTPAFPAWQGNQLFGLEDPSCEGLNLPAISYPGFAKNDRELWDRDDPPIDFDLDGYFQEIPECWRKHRAMLRRMFQLAPERVQAIEAWRNEVTDGGRRTLVAISVRRGDYYRLELERAAWFRIVPEKWYLDWLRKIWPTLRDPVLFVASDEPENVVPAFQEFKPIPTPGGSITGELPHHISDFEVLRRADYLVICNSSFPRFAAILGPSTQKCYLPSFTAQCFEPYEPWIDPDFWSRFEDAGSSVTPFGEPAGNARQPSIFFEVSDLLLSLPVQSGLSGMQRIHWQILSNVLDVAGSKPVCLAVLKEDGGLGTIETKPLLDMIDSARSGATSGAGIELGIHALLSHWAPCAIQPGDVILAAGAFWNVSGIANWLQSLKISGAIVGLFIHDLNPMASPECFEPAGARRVEQGMLGALTLADFIFTASEYNKSALIKHMGHTLDAVPVQVLPLGHQLSLPAAGEISPAVAAILETDYVLCIGTIEAHKNPAYLFQIWKMMTSSGRLAIPRLVFAGPKGWLAEDFLRQLEACQYLQGLVLVLHDATDAELDSLYRNCLLTAYPSFAEGWASPVGESLARGKICLCSSEGGLREGIGPLADYVDPYNIRDGFQTLLHYLDNPDLRQNRELEIINQFTPRSWRQAAESILSSTLSLARRARRFESVNAPLLPPDQYVPVSSVAELSAESACLSGWFPAEISGVRARGPAATIRFRVNAPVGTRINLVLRLTAHNRAFRIRIYSGSGAHTEVSLSDASNSVPVLPALVEPGQLVTAHLLTVAGAHAKYESPAAFCWMLHGILYFDPRRAIS